MERPNLIESAKSLRICSSEYSPPSKPLPTIPDLRYPSFLHFHSSDSLLSHPIPSPSITLDDAMMSSYYAWSTYSIDDSDVESRSTRTSSETILDYVHNLLPPAPLSQIPVASANIVDCRLRQKACKESIMLRASPLSRQNTTSKSINSGEYISHYQTKARSINRRSSSVFPRSENSGTITPVPSLDLSRSSTATTMESDSPITPHNHNVLSTTSWTTPPFQERSTTRNLINHEPALRNISPPIPLPHRDVLKRHEQGFFYPSRPAPYVPALAEGQKSFMHWDDEVDDKYSRVAKVKKSFVDLKGSGRSRSNSVPIQSSTNTTRVHDTIETGLPSIYGNELSTVEVEHDTLGQVAWDKSSKPLSWLSRKKSKHLRRTTVDYENNTTTNILTKARRTTKSSNEKPVPAPPLPRGMAVNMAVDVSKHSGRPNGFARLTRWMRRMMKPT